MNYRQRRFQINVTSNLAFSPGKNDSQSKIWSMKQNNHPASRGPSIFLDKWGRGKSRWLAEVPSSSRLTYKMAHYRLRKMEVFRPSMYFILHGPIKLSIAFKLLLGWQLAKSERGQIFGHLYFIQQILINPDRVNYRKKTQYLEKNPRSILLLAYLQLFTD